MRSEWHYRNYLNFITENMPNSKIVLEETQVLKELFLRINDVYTLCNILDSDQFKGMNFYNLLQEFKSYITRIMLIITLNDKYSIDTVIRLLVEKLYRIIYGLNNTHLLESSIRKHEKSKMKGRLLGKLNKQTELDSLYSEYSDLIHHTNSTPTDLLNFRQLYSASNNLIQETIIIIERLVEVFNEDFFIVISQIYPLGLAAKRTLIDELSEKTKSEMERFAII